MFNNMTDNLRRMNVEVKPSRLLPAWLAYRGLRYACPRLPTSASDVYCPPGKASLFVIHSSLFTIHYSFFVIPVCDLLELGFILVYVNQIPFYPFTFLLFYFSKYSWYSEDLCSFKTRSKGMVWDIFRLPLRRCDFSSYEGRDMYHSIEKPID